jgi:uncharacterized protein YegJ (DUF2314 family)
MRPASLTLIVVLIALGGCSSSETPSSSSESAIPPPAAMTAEMQMQAATQRARDTLDLFELRVARPPALQTFIGVQGRFEEDGVAEQLWISGVTVTDEGYRGKVAGEPMLLKKFAPGQELLVKREAVSDWFAVDDGRLVGGFALRVERSRMSAIERADYDAYMGFRVVD